jgi:hypothetical protein
MVINKHSDILAFKKLEYQWRVDFCFFLCYNYVDGRKIVNGGASCFLLARDRITGKTGVFDACFPFIFGLRVLK